MNYITYFDCIYPLDLNGDWESPLKSAGIWNYCKPIYDKYSRNGNKIIRFLTVCNSPQYNVARKSSNRLKMKENEAISIGLDLSSDDVKRIIENKCDVSKKYLSHLFENIKGGSMYRTYLSFLDFYSERDKLISEGFSNDISDSQFGEDAKTKIDKIDVRFKELEIRDKLVVSAIKNQYGFNSFTEFERHIETYYKIRFDESELSEENKEFNLSDAVEKLKIASGDKKNSKK